MKRNFQWLVFAASIFLLFPFSCASRCDDPRGEGSDDKPVPAQTVLTGTISIKGSEPFTFVALTVEGGGVYKIVGPLEDELSRHYQYNQVTLSGFLMKEDGGPGMPAEFLAEKKID